MNDNELIEPSENFKLAVRHSSSCRILCELCGREHFVIDSSGYTWEDGELEDLLKMSEKDPDKFIGCDYDGVSWGTINGKQAVIDCQCNKLRGYEDFIWNHRYMIMDYFRRRMTEEIDCAKGNFEEMNKTSKMIEEKSWMK